MPTMKKNHTIQIKYREKHFVTYVVCRIEDRCMRVALHTNGFLNTKLYHTKQKTILNLHSWWPRKNDACMLQLRSSDPFVGKTSTTYIFTDSSICKHVCRHYIIKKYHNKLESYNFLYWISNKIIAHQWMFWSTCIMHVWIW